MGWDLSEHIYIIGRRRKGKERVLSCSACRGFHRSSSSGSASKRYRAKEHLHRVNSTCRCVFWGARAAAFRENVMSFFNTHT